MYSFIAWEDLASKKIRKVIGQCFSIGHCFQTMVFRLPSSELPRKLTTKAGSPAWPPPPPVSEISPDDSDTNYSMNRYLQIILNKLIIPNKLQLEIAAGIVGVSESKADFLSKAVKKAFFPSHLAILYFVNNGGLFFYFKKKVHIFLPFQVWIRFSLLISGQTILSYHPAVRLREPAQWAVLHLCMRILTSGLLVVVKNSSTRTWFRGGLCAGCRATYWFQKCVACFPKEVGCHYVCESLYFDMKRNWKGNCFERFWNTSSVISISYSDNQCNPIIIRGKCSLETCPDVKVTLSVTGLIMGHQVP